MEGFDISSLASQATELVTTWGLRVVGAIAVLIVGRAVAARIRRAMGAVLDARGADPTLVPFVTGLVYTLCMAFVIIAVLGLFGIPTASFVAVLGAAGLAVGLAMQGTLSNFAAGVMLLVFRPFQVGDVVETGGATGKVEAIGIFTTTLNTPDNVRVIVPNSDAFGGVIKNYTGNEIRRVDLVMGVSYDDDLAVARQTIVDTIAEADGILSDPEPVVALHELADSSVNFVVRPWCSTEDYWAVRWDLTEKLKLALEAAGCSIPYPQRDVHLFEAGKQSA
ncbi:MAG: mechanosensitive ion channel [Gemmatimonadota bacterium]|nr:mechanosensitive ion channel [Gemmatimonadota bacterium]